MNFKRLASAVLAAAAGAAVLAVARLVAPHLSPEVQGSLMTAAVGVAHWLDAWGANPVVPANVDPPA